MEKQIEIINDIIFNAIQHGADYGGSYESNYLGLYNSIHNWIIYNNIKNYKIEEIERLDNFQNKWKVIQIIKL